MNIINKLSIFITIFIISFGVFFITPKKANAFLGIADVDVGSMMNAVKEYGIDTLTTILNNRILDKLIADTVNWANNGFDGSPGFVNNWDGFLEGVKYDVLSSSLALATKEAYLLQNSADTMTEEEKAQCLADANTEYRENLKKVETSKTYFEWMENTYSATSCSGAFDVCFDDEINDGSSEDDAQVICDNIENNCYTESELKLIELGLSNPITAEEAESIFKQKEENCRNGYGNSGVWGDIGNIAQENYYLHRNTGVLSARSAAETIMSYGAQKLNDNVLEQLIQGSGETLTYLLGSPENVNNFKNDFAYGGWEGYMALADPHNTEVGRNSLIESVLSQQTHDSPSAVEKAKEELSSPKYLSRKTCVEWGEMNEKTKERECIREEIATPSVLVESSMKKVMESDKDRSMIARELSDVLASALGRLTKGLIQVGVSKLKDKFSNDGGSGGNNAENMNNEFAEVYQNQYDVLGIANEAAIFNGEGEDINGDGVISEDEITGNEGSNNNYGDLIGGDASVPYVGGPEDLIGADWDEGPELIVELKGNLEKSLNLVEDYINLNTQIKKYISGIKDNIATLDYCKPGPDYNWEERYKDKAQFAMKKLKDTDSEDKCAELEDMMNLQFYDIGLPTIKELNNDPALNIPGITEMSSAITTVLGGTNKGITQFDEGGLEGKRALFNLLFRMKYEIENNPSFITAKNKLDEKIPLFKSDIYSFEKINEEEGATDDNIIKTEILTDDDLIRILSLKTNNDSESDSYLVSERGLYVFKGDETPESFVKNNRAKAEDVALSLGWNIWREVVDPKIKSKLRYQFHIMKNDLTTERDILELQIKLKNTKNSAGTIDDYVYDCKVFLQQIFNGTDILSDKEIKNFLEEEYAKQENEQESLFRTQLYTSPLNINTSILKFENENEIDEYIDNMYSQIYDEDKFSNKRNIPKSIKDIIDKDQTIRTVLYNNEPFNKDYGPNQGKELFCIVPDLGETDSDYGGCIKHKDFYLCDAGHNGEATRSGQKWYLGRNIDYKASFVGI